MAEIVRMPKMSDTMTEGVVVKWHKKVGDKVKSGELVAEVETDKATMEYESYHNGTVLYLGVEEGKAVAIDGVLAIVGKEGEDYKALLDAEMAKAPAAAKPVEEAKPAPAPKVEAPKPAPAPVAAPVAVPVASSSSSDDRTKASPLAKRLASEKGIDLSMLKGSGDHGRIVKRDIEWFKPGTFVQTAAFARMQLRQKAFQK